MKNTLLLTAILSLPVCAGAQITLNAANAPSVAICQQNDTMQRLKVTGTIVSFTPASNAIWDLTTMTDSTSIFSDNEPYSGAAFPSATFSQPGVYYLSSLAYYATGLFHVTSTGIINYGEHVSRQSLAIGAISGSVTDTLTFPEQDITFTSNPKSLKYPCTMGTTWTEVIPYTTHFELSIAAYGLSNTPGERRSRLTRTYNVVGWGKMRINNGGTPTAYADVLEIEVSHMVVDSFYLAGSPAPATLLSAFGTSQGQVSENNYRNFYRAGEFCEMAKVLYTDNTYSTVRSINVHKQRLPMPATSVATNIKEQQISVYPNPVTGSTFTITVNHAGNDASYQLYNIVGQTIASGIIPAGGVISLNNDIPAGSYFVKVKTQDGSNITQPIQIVR